MDRKQFREAAFAKALQAGCTGAELVVTGGEEFGAGVQAGKLDTYTVSRTQAFGLRVQYKGKNGYASTEAPEDPGALVAAAMDNAAAVETGDVHPMAEPAAYPAITPPPDALAGMGNREKIRLCRELEAMTLAQDPRVKRVASCKVITVKGYGAIYNTLGLNAQREDALSCILVNAILEDGAEVHDGGAFRARGEALDLEGCAREAVAEIPGAPAQRCGL